jgi:thiopeptide-type bacteriocin biosynthesis protein
MMEADKYLPFDEWIYLKIYTGYRTADKILKEILQPAWLAYYKNGKTEKWFYIRYTDTDFHLRFRIKLSDPSFRHEILQQIINELKPYSRSGLIWKVDVSTYTPEKERYGKLTMESAEDIFCADSNAVLAHIRSIETDQDVRWLFALASANNFLDNFKFDLAQKKDLLLKLSRGYGKEFGKNADLAKQLSAKFRDRRMSISQYLSKKQPILIERTEKIRDPVNEIISYQKKGKLDVDLNELVSSIIHMSMNRIFQTHSRVYEMVLYDLLFRHYKCLFLTNIK